MGLLRRRHPLLAARIREVGGYPAFDTEGVPPTPFRVLQRRSDEDWMSHAEDELNSTFDLATGPLARVVYFAPEGAERRAEILLTMQHVIVDAASATRLTRELLALCAQTED